MIKQSCNLTGLEIQLAIPNQMWQSQMISFFDDFLHAKNLRNHLIASGYIDGQRILLSDWLRAFYAITEELESSQA